MKAQLLFSFGGPENFRLADVSRPEPAVGQMRVAVAAIGLNSLELKIRNGWLEAFFPTPLPAILGKEFAGTVVALGAGVQNFSVGDRVVGFADTGVYAEFALARMEAVARIPDTLSFELAATLPVALETARRGIALLEVQPGWTVVINGASGTVGSAAGQLLTKQGIKVIGTASPANHGYLRSIGVVPVAYGPDVATSIRQLSPGGIDAVFDVAGFGFASAAVDLTGDAKRVLTIADFEAAKFGIRTSTGNPRPTAKSFEDILPLAASGAFTTTINQSFSLSDIALAHQALQAGSGRGKIVVTV